MRSLRAQRDRDGLTGLLNRPALEREVSRFLASREPKEAVFFMFDLDDFKGVNDRYGHDAGDEVLKAVASSIQEVFRSGDIVARLGGRRVRRVLVHGRRASFLRSASKADSGNGVFRICAGYWAAMSFRERRRRLLSIGRFLVRPALPPCGFCPVRLEEEPRCLPCLLR